MDTGCDRLSCKYTSEYIVLGVYKLCRHCYQELIDTVKSDLSSLVTEEDIRLFIEVFVHVTKPLVPDVTRQAIAYKKFSEVLDPRPID